MSGMLNPFAPERVRDLVRRVQACTRQQLIDITLLETERNQENIKRQFGLEAPTQLFVDGTEGKLLEQAQQFTLTRFEMQGGVVDAAIRMLMERSPVGPDKDGHYKDDHWLFVNNVRRDAAAEGHLIELEPGDHAVIINMRPYARKIEGGARSRFSKRLSDRRPGLSAQAPNGVYEITSRDLQRLYGNVAIIRFTYRAMMGTDLVERDEPAEPKSGERDKRGRFQYSGGTLRHNLSQNRFPALEIESRLGF